MLSGALALAMTASAAAVMPASAEKTAKYLMLFLPLMKTQALLSIQNSFTLNGNAYTNGVSRQLHNILISMVLLQMLTILLMKTTQSKKPKMYLMSTKI